jgi:voltage-gated potassium channel
MAGLTLVYVALSVLADEGVDQLIGAVLAALALVFFLEFAVRFLDADSRLEYLKEHWIDLVTCLPAIGPLRVLRLLRLVGLLRLTHQMREIALIEADRATSSESSPTWIVWPTALLLWLGAADGFWIVERGHNPAIHNFGDALYLAFITVTTVGYGDVRPVTAEGRVIAGALVFLGLGLLGFISAQLTARWLRTEHKETEIEAKLAELTDEIRALRTAMMEQRSDAANQGHHDATPALEARFND